MGLAVHSFVSAVLVVTRCDGRGRRGEVECPRATARKGPRPSSWLRLLVTWTLPTGTNRSGHVTICSPLCAASAVAAVVGQEFAGATA